MPNRGQVSGTHVPGCQTPPQQYVWVVNSQNAAWQHAPAGAHWPGEHAAARSNVPAHSHSILISHAPVRLSQHAPAEGQGEDSQAAVDHEIPVQEIGSESAIQHEPS